MKSYNFESYWKKWDEKLTEIYEKHGGWGQRKDYKRWTLTEVTK